MTGGIHMDFKKIIKRGVIIALACTLISMLGMGIIDFMALGIIAAVVLILACLSTIIHNQNAGD